MYFLISIFFSGLIISVLLKLNSCENFFKKLPFTITNFCYSGFRPWGRNRTKIRKIVRYRYFSINYFLTTFSMSPTLVRILRCHMLSKYFCRNKWKQIFFLSLGKSRDEITTSYVLKSTFPPKHWKWFFETFTDSFFSNQ